MKLNEMKSCNNNASKGNFVLVLYYNNAVLNVK